MSKKSKRNVSQPVSSTSTARAVKPTSPVSDNKAQVAAVSSSNRFSTTFNPDYAPVRKDLTRIAILAVTFFVVLVVLSFFLR